MKTSCRFCEFKLVDKNNIQTGCQIKGLLDKYSNKGIEVTLTDNNDEHGADKSFIVDTFCLYRRPSGWKEAQKNTNYQEQARSELHVKLNLVIYIPNNTFNDFDNQIKEISNKIKGLKNPPSKVIFMCSDKKRSILDFKRLDNYLDIPWSLDFLLDENIDISKVRKGAYDLASKKVNTTYFLALDWDQVLKLDDNILQSFENKIIDELDNILCVVPENIELGTPGIYHTSTYRSLLGNKEKDFSEKIRLIAEEQECSPTIKECSYLQ